jgi:hypothetical protein
MIEIKFKVVDPHELSADGLPLPVAEEEMERRDQDRQDSQEKRPPPESRLAYHLRCLREDATEPALSQLERLALVMGDVVD